MRILLQFPEGLKQKALAHAKALEKDGNEVFISASPTFGACDLALDEARNIKADKLIHFGHAEFHHVDFNVEYIEYRIDAPLTLLGESLAQMEGAKTISVMTTIQHIHQLDEIRKFYEGNGKTVVVGTPYGFAKRKGQILGCDIGSAASVDQKVDMHVYFGGGMFHPLGALLATKKPFLVIEPFENKIERIDRLRDTFRKRSMGKVMRALDAKRFGILVSTKNGQHNMNLARIIKERVERAGVFKNKLLDVDYENATSALIHITGGEDLTLGEANEIGRIITEKISPNANVIWGARIDPNYNGKVEIITIFTGVESPEMFGKKEGAESRSSELGLGGI